MPIAKTCEHCGKVVYVTPTRAAEFRFCCRACKDAATIKKSKVSVCKACGKRFVPCPDSMGKYCSKLCGYAGRRGLSLEEYIAVIEKKKIQNEDVETPQTRRCHDCGKACSDYRCQSCWKKRGRTNFTDENEYE